MGNETSRSTPRATRRSAESSATGKNHKSDSPLYHGVPAHLTHLVTNLLRATLEMPANLLMRPDQLDHEHDLTHAETHIPPADQKLAQAALADRALAHRLQKARDALVPTRLSEPKFWEHFLAHLDVIKVRVVTDYLRAQELVAEVTRAKHADWLRQYDALPPTLRQDVKVAAEAICEQQTRPASTTAEKAQGYDAGRLPRWVASESQPAWLAYAHDGPYDVSRFLHARLARRARDEEAMAQSGTFVSSISAPEEHLQREGLDPLTDAISVATPTPRADFASPFSDASSSIASPPGTT